MVGHKGLKIILYEKYGPQDQQDDHGKEALGGGKDRSIPLKSDAVPELTGKIVPEIPKGGQKGIKEHHQEQGKKETHDQVPSIAGRHGNPFGPVLDILLG